MDRRKRFCVICGSEESPSTKLEGGLCQKCSATRRLDVEVLDPPTIKVCRICGSLDYRGRWLNPSSRGLEEDLRTLLRTISNRFVRVNSGQVSEILIPRMPSSMNPNSIFVPVTIKVQTRSKENGVLSREFNTNMRLTPTTCPNCSLIRQKYYEAILQIRASEGIMRKEDKEKILSQIEPLITKSAKTRKQAFVTKYEDRPGGFDLYLGSRQVGYSIASWFKAIKRASVKETFKAGRIDKSTGKRKGKATILIRLTQKEKNEGTENNV